MATLNFLAVQITIAKKILVGSFTFEGFPFETLLPSCLLLYWRSAPTSSTHHNVSGQKKKKTVVTFL